LTGNASYQFGVSPPTYSLPRRGFHPQPPTCTDVVVSYADVTLSPAITSMSVTFTPSQKMYEWSSIPSVGIYNISFKGTIAENGYYRQSYLILNITELPLPYVKSPNSGPPYFTEPLKDVEIEVGQVY